MCVFSVLHNSLSALSSALLELSVCRVDRQPCSAGEGERGGFSLRPLTSPLWREGGIPRDSGGPSTLPAAGTLYTRSRSGPPPLFRLPGLAALSGFGELTPYYLYRIRTPEVKHPVFYRFGGVLGLAFGLQRTEFWVFYYRFARFFAHYRP